MKCTVVGVGKKSSQLTVSLTGEQVEVYTSLHHPHPSLPPGAVVVPRVGTVLQCLVHEVTPLYLILTVPWGWGLAASTSLTLPMRIPTVHWKSSKAIVR